jgi:uncharacterized OB-fold protein
VTEPSLPTRPPRRTHETAPFWDGCARGVLVLPRCDRCGELIWYPRRFCPFCASTSVSWVEVTGHGTVYSCTVLRRGEGAYREAAPFVLAYVELDEGPRVLTNIVGVAPEAVTVGMPVQVVFDPAGDGDAIPRFRPAAP